MNLRAAYIGFLSIATVAYGGYHLLPGPDLGVATVPARVEVSGYDRDDFGGWAPGTRDNVKAAQTIDGTLFDPYARAPAAERVEVDHVFSALSSLGSRRVNLAAGKEDGVRQRSAQPCCHRPQLEPSQVRFPAGGLASARQPLRLFPAPCCGGAQVPTPASLPRLCGHAPPVPIRFHLPAPLDFRWEKPRTER